MTAAELDLFLTIDEAARIAKRTPNALYLLRHAGKGHRVRKVDGRLLVHRDDLLAWLAGDDADSA